MYKTLFTLCKQKQYIIMNWIAISGIMNRTLLLSLLKKGFLSQIVKLCLSCLRYSNFYHSGPSRLPQAIQLIDHITAINRPILSLQTYQPSQLRSITDPSKSMLISFLARHCRLYTWDMFTQRNRQAAEIDRLSLTRVRSNRWLSGDPVFGHTEKDALCFILSIFHKWF